MKGCQKILFSLLALAVVVGGYFLYMAWAFPTTPRCTARHLQTPEEGDCYSCHMKATARVAQEWYESKHGVVLVRCQTCHGMPDGKGAIPFARKPGVDVCARCHSLAIDKMEAKFGVKGDCVTCHPHHQSPMHGNAYQYRQPSTQTDL